MRITPNTLPMRLSSLFTDGVLVSNGFRQHNRAFAGDRQREADLCDERNQSRSLRMDKVVQKAYKP